MNNKQTTKSLFSFVIRFWMAFLCPSVTADKLLERIKDRRVVHHSCAVRS